MSYIGVLSLEGSAWNMEIGRTECVPHGFGARAEPDGRMGTVPTDRVGADRPSTRRLADRAGFEEPVAGLLQQKKLQGPQRRNPRRGGLASGPAAALDEYEHAPHDAPTVRRSPSALQPIS